MGSIGTLAQLNSLPELIGAAVALDAESVGPVSRAEQRLARSPSLVRPSRADLASLRELILDGSDPLGDAFCRLRSPTERRSDGATYTPSPIVQSMVDWAASETSEFARVIDPGSGSARFATAAASRFRAAEVVAVEIDPLAALLSRANLAVRGLADRSTVVVSDYRRFVTPSSEGRTLYIGNPPYVRHHKIAPEWKQWLTKTAEAVGQRASQLAGLHVYFFLSTVLNAKPGDRGVFITSSEWLDVNYGALLRDLVLDGLGGRSIHVIAPEVELFEDAQTTGAITCFEIASKPTSVRLKRVKRVQDLGKLDGGQAVRRERLAEARRWTPLLRAARKPPAGYIELGELCRVHRGAVTGANRIWVVDAAETDLPDRVLFPSVTRGRELFAAGHSLGTSRGLRAVIDLPRDLDQLDAEERKPVERFIRRARREGVHHGYIARHRQSWWSVGLRKPAPILATYMARRPPAIVRNLVDAHHINIAHGLYPREPLAARVLDGIAKRVRDCITIGHGRTYAGGLTKFEPKELERLLIPGEVISSNGL
jgi:adenine-specific DNA-methyltransferase